MQLNESKIFNILFSFYIEKLSVGCVTWASCCPIETVSKIIRSANSLGIDAKSTVAELEEVSPYLAYEACCTSDIYIKNSVSGACYLMPSEREQEIIDLFRFAQ